MLGIKLFELHRKAQRLGFACYVRRGHVPPLLKGMIGATASVDAFRRYDFKYNHNHDELGRFDFGDGSNTIVSPSGKNPGAVPVKLHDGSIVNNPKTGQPLLMPKGVSLQDNAKIGENMRSLPSVFSGDIASPNKEGAMIGLLGTNRPMDYQRLYDGGTFNKTYTDFGNYNYGVVAAASGYTLNQAMFAAGLHNLYVRNTDTSGAYFTDTSENIFIPMGFQDYIAGRIRPKN